MWGTAKRAWWNIYIWGMEAHRGTFSLFSQPCLNLVQTSLESRLMHGRQNCEIAPNYDQNRLGIKSPRATSVQTSGELHKNHLRSLQSKVWIPLHLPPSTANLTKGSFCITSVSLGGIKDPAPNLSNILDFQSLIMLSMIIHMLSCWQATLPV